MATSLTNTPIRRSLRTLVLMLVLVGLCACDRDGPSIDNIKAGGELRVALVSMPHTYYLDPKGIQGFDYELLQAFCDELGITLTLSLVDNREQARLLLADHKVHLAAGLIPVTNSHQDEIRFGPSYSVIDAVAVYHTQRQRPASIGDLVGMKLGTLAGGIGAAGLERQLAEFPDLSWTASAERDSEALLIAIHSGEIDVAIIPATDFLVLRNKYPHLARAFEFGNPRAIAWAIGKRSTRSIDTAIAKYFGRITETGELNALWKRYYGHYGEFDFVDARAFLRAVEDRLPSFRQFFKQAAVESGIDWRLLAALSYQESHWDPDARSPTGVRGLMMLTRRTADQLNVERDVPEQAIEGGARYLNELSRRLPESLVADDRLWFALAAYNVGFGHVEDARVLTQRLGGNPNRWDDVRRYLPKLANPDTAKTLKHGRARGGQAVHFVTNVRRYFNTFRLLERRPVSPHDEKQATNTRIAIHL